MPFDSFSTGPGVGPWWSMPLLPRIDPSALAVSTLNTFDGGTDGTTITTGNSGGASGDAWSFVSIAATGSATYFALDSYRGGMSGRFSIGTTAGLVYAEKLTGNGSVGSLYVRVRFRMPVLPADATGVRFAVVADGPGAFQIDGRMTNAGTVELRTGTGSLVGTSSATYAAGQWVDVGLGILSFSATTGVIEMKLYDSAGAVAQTITSAATVDTLRGGGANKLQVGAIRSGITSFTVDMDDPAMSSVGYPDLPVAPPSIAGGAASTTSATGDLTVTSALAGAAATASSATGSLTQTSPLAGAAATVTTAVGDLTVTAGATTYAITGAAASTTSAAGSLTRVTPITGAATSSSSATGALTLRMAFAGAAASTTSAAGALTRVTPISGAAASTTAAAGDLTVTSGAIVWSISGAASSTSSATAAVTVRGALSGAAASVTLAAGSVTLRAAIAGTASSSTSASALLGLRMLIAGGGSSISAALASLSLVGPVAAITVRPNTGTTARPGSGTTVRPNTGTTARATGTTVRPYVGTTTRP